MATGGNSNMEIKYYYSSIIGPSPNTFIPDLSFFARIRMRIRSVRGYIIIAYFEYGKSISYVVLKHNYLYRYTFLKKNDMIINPYWTHPDYRKKGIATKLLKEVVKNENNVWDNLYAVVEIDNIGSINCLEAVGFGFFGYAIKRKKWFYDISQKRKSMLLVYRYFGEKEK